MAWKLFLKYKKAKRNHKLTIYYHFMRKLQDKVDKRYSNIDQIKNHLNLLKLKRIISEMINHTKYSKKKK